MFDLEAVFYVTIPIESGVKVLNVEWVEACILKQTWYSSISSNIMCAPAVLFGQIISGSMDLFSFTHPYLSQMHGQAEVLITCPVGIVHNTLL